MIALRWLVLPCLLLALGAHPVAAEDTPTIFYVYVVKDGVAADWVAFEFRDDETSRKKLDALKARMKAKHGVDDTTSRTLMKDRCGVLYRTSDNPKSYFMKYAEDWKHLINMVASMQVNHQASRPYELEVVDMRCNGDFTPPGKLGEPWASWKPAPNPEKIRKEDAQVVAYMWNKQGQIRTWIGTMDEWMRVRDTQQATMRQGLDLPAHQNAVVLTGSQCLLKVDHPGMRFARPSSPGRFAALVEARKLTEEGTTVSLLMCSDTLTGKAIVKRYDHR